MNRSKSIHTGTDGPPSLGVTLKATGKALSRVGLSSSETISSSVGYRSVRFSTTKR